VPVGQDCLRRRAEPPTYINETLVRLAGLSPSSYNHTERTPGRPLTGGTHGPHQAQDPATFIGDRAPMSWREVRFGLLNELLDPLAAVDLAVEFALCKRLKDDKRSSGTVSGRQH